MKPRPVTVYTEKGKANYTGMMIGWGLGPQTIGLADGPYPTTQAIIEKDCGSVALVPVERFFFDERPPIEL